MALPNENPANPSLPAPLFADVDAVRGDQLRANNQLIYENEEYLDEGQNINDAAAATPVDADKAGFFQIAGSILKYVTFANLFLWIVGKFVALATKTTPVSADLFFIGDSEAANAGKTLSYGNLLAALGALYQPKFSAKSAWCVFDGTGASPITIAGGFNITNVIKNSTGNYTINFTNAFANANYAVVASCSPVIGSDYGVVIVNANSVNNSAPGVSSCRIMTVNRGTSAPFDPSYVNVFVIGA